MTTTHNDIRELATAETDRVSGGLIAASLSIGTKLPYYAAYNPYVSELDKHALNPQPLPPKQLFSF